MSDVLPPQRSAPLEPLTSRENEVLGWIGVGKSNPEIAEILGIAERTVGKHCENIFRKLGVENRTAAAVWWVGRSGEGGSS